MSLSFGICPSPLYVHVTLSDARRGWGKRTKRYTQRLNKTPVASPVCSLFFLSFAFLAAYKPRHILLLVYIGQHARPQHRQTVFHASPTPLFIQHSNTRHTQAMSPPPPCLPYLRQHGPGRACCLGTQKAKSRLRSIRACENDAGERRKRLWLGLSQHTNTLVHPASRQDAWQCTRGNNGVLCLATPAYSCPLLEPRCLPHLLTSDTGE